LSPGRSGQLHQGQFHFLVSRYPGAVLLPEGSIHVVGQPHGHLQQFALAGGVVVGYGRFHQMTGAIVLVLFHVGPALVEAHQAIIGVQVAVGFLGGGDLVDPLVGLLFQGGIRVVLKRVGNGLQGFVHVGVVVVNAFVFLALLSGHLFEIADAGRFHSVCSMHTGMVTLLTFSIRGCQNPSLMVT
jgi:hypothetical protein